MKDLVLLLIISLIGLTLCQRDPDKNATNRCLDMSSTIYRASCKQAYALYPVILLDHQDDIEANRHFDLMKPMLEPCIKLETENNRTERDLQSKMVFLSANSDQGEVLGDCVDFLYFDEVASMSSMADIYRDKPERGLPYSHFTSFNWGLNDLHIIALFSKIVDMELKCHGTNNTNWQPIILVLTNLDSNYAAVKFQDLSRRYTSIQQKNLSQTGIMMKVIWTRPQDGNVLTEVVEKYLLNAQNSTQGFITHTIDDLSIEKKVREKYGMCAADPGDAVDATGPPVAQRITLSVGAVLLFVLFLCIVIAIVFTQTNWLNRPAYVFFRFLEDRLKIKFKFLVRIHQDITDAGFERYVQEYTRGQDDWEIDPANLHISTELLGSGVSALVYKGILSGVPPVVKLFPKARLMGLYSTIENSVAIKRPHENGGAEERIEFLQEIRFMKTLNFHPHILTMLGCYFYPFQPLIVTELCELGDLLTLVREFGDPKTRAQCPIDSDVFPVMAWQVCDALSFLSTINIIHRDIAARNILVSAAKIAKLSDFGLCRRAKDLMYSSTKKQAKMPLKWMAPEAIEKAEYSHKSDVWSYGVLLYEVFSYGTVPYPTISSEAVLEFIKKGNRLEVPQETPEWMEELMGSCWSLLPNDRPSASDLKTILYSKIEANISGYGYLQMSELDEMETSYFLNDGDDDYENPTHKATLVSVAVPTFNLKEVFGADTMASFLYVINMEWQDSRLAFDPKDFNNDTYIYLPISEIWRPIVKNANAVESKKVNERNEEDRSEAQIMSDGRVQTSDVYYSKILCSGRMDRFPFDIQFCDVSLMNFSVNQTVMRLQAVRTESHFFMGNAEFHATNYIAASIKPQLIGFYNKLEFVISLERKTFYFIFVIVLPAALITTLTITGVMLPSSAEEPGDPVNIGLTSLLALSITFTVVADNFPRSAKVPLLGWDYCTEANHQRSLLLIIPTTSSISWHQSPRFLLDHLTKFVSLRALKTKTAKEVVEHLIAIYGNFGALRILQTENGREFVHDFTCNNEELDIMRQKMAAMIEYCKSLQIISPMSGYERVFDGNAAEMVNLEFMKSETNACEEIIKNLIENGIPSKNWNAQMLLIVKNGAQLKSDLSRKKFVLKQLKDDKTFVKMAVNSRERRRIVQQFLSCPPLAPLNPLMQIFGNDNQKTAQVFRNEKLTILLDYVKIKDYNGDVKDLYLFVQKNEK
ncbi:unnamed protein product, partial [Mesorhabditis belari]|uniref:Protein kinase domain-containing protein n=1 Tax=Mesorhabditis belari TaxID=2138241 RepID=A0AAF3EEL9_9BILA